jgi:hypothetical protein
MRIFEADREAVVSRLIRPLWRGQRGLGGIIRLRRESERKHDMRVYFALNPLLGIAFPWGDDSLVSKI